MANTLVIGGGNVGLGAAASLLAGGTPVDLVARPKTAAALAAGGLCRTGILGEYHADPVEFGIYTSIGMAPDGYEHVVVAVKCFSAAEVACDLAAHPWVGASASIILMMNGWGSADEFARVFPRESVYSARVITGFQKTAENVVDVTVHAGDILIGALFTDRTDGLAGFCTRMSFIMQPALQRILF